MPQERLEPRDLIRGLPFYFSTGFFLLFAAVSLLLVPVYLYSPSQLFLPLIVNGILLAAAAIDFVSGPSPGKISIGRPLPYPLAVDRPNEIFLEVSNATGLTIDVIVQDDFPDNCRAELTPARAAVAPGSGSRLVYRLIPAQRGYGLFGDVHFWVRGRLGLIWKRGQSPAAAGVRLYPGLDLARGRGLGVRRPDAFFGGRSRWKSGAGAEFDSLRDYVAGDDSRLIHWKTSARKGRLSVRQNRVERSQTVFLILDAGRQMTARVLGKTKLDHALNAALLVAHTALQVGDKVGLMVVARDICCFLPPSQTPGQFGRILDATFSMEPRMEEPRFHLALSTFAAKWKRRALVLIFTDLVDDRASEGLIRCALGLLPRHLPVVAAMSDAEVVRIADLVPQDESDLYRQGVASAILDRRESLIARMRATGIMVVDAPPDKISIGALDRYIEIKTRNML
jgi:uncharacterized protein (DUF58 family)